MIRIGKWVGYLMRSNNSLFSQMRTIEQARKNSLKLDRDELVQYIEMDTGNGIKYKHYGYLMRQFHGYVQDLDAKNKNEGLYDVLYQISKYPKIDVNEETLHKLYNIICRQLYHRNNTQLNKALLFVLKGDHQAEQSLIYIEYLKHYLSVRAEVIKAKYQINYRELSIGQFLKRLLKKMVQKGFMSRHPEYDKELTVRWPNRTLELVMENRSTRESMLIKKINYGLFLEVKEIYEEGMHENVYNSRNVQIWNKLNHMNIFEYSEWTQNENSHLRQLYITLFLVLRSQTHNLENDLRVIIMGYKYMKQHIEDSQKLAQFRAQVQALVKEVHLTKVYKEEIDRSLFYIVQMFPSKQQEAIQIILSLLVPLTFQIYFASIIKLPISCQQFTKINEDQQYFDRLNLEQLAELSDVEDRELRHNILNSCYQRDFDSIKESHILSFFRIYLNTRTLPQSNTLRTFIFRYVVDHHTQFSLPTFQVILGSIVELNDRQLFNDEENSYPHNIFEQIEDYTLQVKDEVSEDIKMVIEQFFKMGTDRK